MREASTYLSFFTGYLGQSASFSGNVFGKKPDTWPEMTAAGERALSAIFAGGTS
jgi:hypothetical protein